MLFIVAVLISFQSCEDLLLIEATSKSWSGGISGAPGGLHYRMVLVAMKNSDKLKIDQLWVKEKLYMVQAGKKMPSRFSDGFSVNDTIYVNVTHIEVEVSDTKTESLSRPTGIDSEMILGYIVNGKRKYIGTNDIQILNSVANP